LVIDISGSMRAKRSDVIAAGLAFARNSNSQDQMFVINFNQSVSFGLPGSKPFTNNPAELEAALTHLANGQTALYDAIAAGLEHLKKGDRDKKVLIVISDGADNASRIQLDQVVALAKQSDAIIYTVGIFEPEDPDHNPKVLKQLAETTGGETFLPEAVRDVIPVCERIAHDIRSQYTLAYTPTNPKPDGNYRLIQVTATPPDGRRLRVRTRAGYYNRP
jgi:VWFA-related protein